MFNPFTLWARELDARMREAHKQCSTSNELYAILSRCNDRHADSIPEAEQGSILDAARHLSRIGHTEAEQVSYAMGGICYRIGKRMLNRQEARLVRPYKSEVLTIYPSITSIDEKGTDTK